MGKIWNRFMLGVYPIAIISFVLTTILIICGYSMPLALQVIMALLSTGVVIEAFVDRLGKVKNNE